MSAAVSAVYPPEIWARESLMVLQNHNVMAPLVHRNFESEVAQFGDVVNTRRPDVFTAADLTNDLTSDMTVSAATATNVAISLDKHKHVAFGITNRDQATSIKNLIDEFMEPAMIPLAEAVDADLLQELAGGVDGGSDGISVAEMNVANSTTPGDPDEEVVVASGFDKTELAAVQRKLIEKKVPFAPVGGTSRVSLVMSPKHHSEVITSSEVIGADTSGLNPPPIRTGFVATLFGMNVYVDQQVPVNYAAASNASPSQQSVAFHRNACTLVTRPLEQVGSEFGVRSSTMVKDGVGLRVMMSYEHRKAQWLVSCDILYGVKLLDKRLAHRVVDTATWNGQ